MNIDETLTREVGQDEGVYEWKRLRVVRNENEDLFRVGERVYVYPRGTRTDSRLGEAYAGTVTAERRSDGYRRIQLDRNPTTHEPGKLVSGYVKYSIPLDETDEGFELQWWGHLQTDEEDRKRDERCRRQDGVW